MSTSPVVYEIPLSPNPQKFNITLSGTDYQLRVTWCKPNQAWTLDIMDSSGNPVLMGLPLVTGSNLLEQFQYLGFEGGLVVQSDFDVNTVPDFNSLGTTGHLYFIPITPASLPATVVRTMKFNLLWQYKVPSKQQVYSSPISATMDGAPVIIFQCWDWYLYVVFAQYGSLHWRKAFLSNNYGRAQAADVNGDGQTEVFGASHDGMIWALDHNVNVLWQFKNLYAREGSGTSTSGTDATHCYDSTQSWLSPAFLRSEGVGFGALLSYTTGAAVGQSREITATAPDHVTVSTPFAPAPSPGDHYLISPRYSSDVFFAHAGTLKQVLGVWKLFVTGYDNGCYRLDAATGALDLKFFSKENNEPYPLIMDVDGDGHLECLFPSLDGYIYCLNAETGSGGAFTQKWATKPDTVNGEGMDAFLSAADINGDGIIEILVSSRSNRVYVLKGTDGSVINQTSDTGGDVDDEPAILDPFPVKRDFVFGNDAGNVYRCNSSGVQVWKISIGEVINSSPQYADINNDSVKEIVVCDMSGRVTIIDPSTGLVIGLLTLDGGIEGVPLVSDVNGDGLLEFCVTTLSGSVYLYQVYWQ